MFDPVNLLAIDTTFAACSVAVRSSCAINRTKVFSRAINMSSGHSEQVMDMIKTVLLDANMSLFDLDGVAVTTGPGSFTGTKIGIAVVRGLALATGVSTFTASSLAVIARRTLSRSKYVNSNYSSLPIAVCVDARRGQLYYQIFSFPGQTALTPPSIGTINDIASVISFKYKKVLLASHFGHDLVKSLNQSGVKTEDIFEPKLPSAKYLLDVDLKPVTKPCPLYLRPPDAKPQTSNKIKQIA
ncbi:MAG: hypothetical protein TECD_00686 [Hyphomicrobiaceae bacterium hypho_1]